MLYRGVYTELCKHIPDSDSEYRVELMLQIATIWGATLASPPDKRDQYTTLLIDMLGIGLSQYITSRGEYMQAISTIINMLSKEVSDFANSNDKKKAN